MTDPDPDTQRDLHGWIDASAGIAGDMLLGALIDAGADPDRIQADIDAVLPDAVRLRTERVTRAGIAATKVHVDVITPDQPHRTWRSIEQMIMNADLAERVRDDALAVFGRLAEAEGAVHGVPAAEIHFHEVGALDSIADVVGCCSAMTDLQLTGLTGSPAAVGSGTVRAAHGRMPVPVPAVTRLSTGWQITAGGEGELTTPTGMALLVGLCRTCAELPEMTLAAVGLGAGSRDTPGRANVTRVLLGEPAAADGTAGTDPAVLLEANVDDLDPRLWPSVLDRLLRAGASDAWLVPIVMKKGRPAHTLCVLAHPQDAAALQQVMLEQTSTIGVRRHELIKYALPRGWVTITLDDSPVAVKIAHRDGRILRATPEFDDLAAAAERSGRPVRELLDAANTAAAAAGLRAGETVPENTSSVRGRPTH